MDAVEIRENTWQGKSTELENVFLDFSTIYDLSPSAIMSVIGGYYSQEPYVPYVFYMLTVLHTIRHFYKKLAIEISEKESLIA